MTADPARAEPGDARRAEQGSAVLELPFMLGLIVIPFALLVLQVPVWVEHQAAATDAAAELARAITVNGRSTDAAGLVAAVERSHGLAAGRLHASLIEGRPAEPVTAIITVDIPALTLPVFGVVGCRSWTTSHTERQPDFASVES